MARLPYQITRLRLPSKGFFLRDSILNCFQGKMLNFFCCCLCLKQSANSRKSLTFMLPRQVEEFQSSLNFCAKKKANTQFQNQFRCYLISFHLCTKRILRGFSGQKEERSSLNCLLTLSLTALLRHFQGSVNLGCM